MRNYELMVIARPNLDETGNQAVVDRISGIITGTGGAVDKIEPTKKRTLAYEIKDLREGFYTLVNFKGEAKTAEELNRVLKITDEVIRFLIVRPEA